MFLAIMMSLSAVAATPDARASDDPVRFLQESFAIMDRNGDGYIDVAEAPNASYRRTRQRAGFPVQIVAEEAGPVVWVRGMDTNRDGRVSQAEFVSQMLPHVAHTGVPPLSRPSA